ncbi:MAG: hypothetical protein AYL30_007240 [Candidatus Hecatellales archaeon B24]|nr:MAG: hypothetical protein AYL30_007240 [Candidatus Hecatellales archaeon B24]
MKALKHVYGPVASWRLGLSLGLDPVSPPKTCTFDCVYCQLGRTVFKVSRPKDFQPKVSLRRLMADLEEALTRIDLKRVKYVTFSGSGEPTLHPQLAEMVEEARRLTGKPVALLTNSSLLGYRKISEAASRFDLVVAKLDAADQRLFEAVNRPAEGLELKQIVKGIKGLRRKMAGKLAIQSMFFRRLDLEASNFSDRNVEALAETVSALMPDEVQVNTPTRPPAEPFVTPLTVEELRGIAKVFREKVSGAHVISRTSLKLARAAGLRKTSEQEVLEVLKRRPCGGRELAAVLNAREAEVSKILGRLMAKGVVAKRMVEKRTYFTAKV